MAVNLGTTARNAAVDAVVDLLDGGSGDASGDIDFQTAGGTSLVTCALSATAFGAASNGVATANSITQGTVGAAITNQTIAKAVFRNKSNTEIFNCDVGLSGAAINLSGTVVSTGDTVSITALTYTQPAS